MIRGAVRSIVIGIAVLVVVGAGFGIIFAEPQRSLGQRDMWVVAPSGEHGFKSEPRRSLVLEDAAGVRRMAPIQRAWDVSRGQIVCVAQTEGLITGFVRVRITSKRGCTAA